MKHNCLTIKVQRPLLVEYEKITEVCSRHNI